MGKADREVLEAKIAAGEEKERKRKAKERRETMKKKKNRVFFTCYYENKRLD